MRQDRSNPRRHVAIVFAAAVLTVAIATNGCSGSQATTRPLVLSPKLETAERCGVGHQQPLIVEWPSGMRATLEARARKGPIPLKVTGCAMEILPRCSVKGASYAYVAVTRKQDRVVMHDTDELYANVPLGAASLEAKLARAGQLKVDMTLVGRFEWDKGVANKSDLEGECEGATHVVSALVTGAFEFFAEGSAEIGTKAAAMGAKAGAGSEASRELLSKDGDPKSCGGSTLADKSPPEGCGALVRLELSAVGADKSATPSCPARTEWNGDHCVAHVVSTKAECPAGMDIVGDTCAPPPVPAASAAPSAAASTSVAVSTDTIPLCVYGDLPACIKRCEIKDAAACNDLALMHARGNIVGKDDAKATALYERACDLGSAIGCNNAGLRYEEGRGVKTDESKAATYYGKSCDASRADACSNLGRLYVNGWGVKRDEPKGAQLMARGCELGDAGSCSNLGWFYVLGRGVDKDKGKGIALLKKGCMAGNAWGCDRLKQLGDKP